MHIQSATTTTAEGEGGVGLLQTTFGSHDPTLPLLLDFLRPRLPQFLRSRVRVFLWFFSVRSYPTNQSGRHLVIGPVFILSVRIRKRLIDIVKKFTHTRYCRTKGCGCTYSKPMESIVRPGQYRRRGSAERREGSTISCHVSFTMIAIE